MMSLPLQRGSSQQPQQQSQFSSFHHHQQQLPVSPGNGHTNGEEDSYDYEVGAPVITQTTLASAESSFDRLWQGVSYRDRQAFAAYVRQEVDRDTDQSGSGSNSTNDPKSPSGQSNPLVTFYSSLSPWWRSLLDRFFLLAGLLFLQSCSSVILSHFADLIQRHVIVTLYLTMLVGAGGNAGNQSSVLVIRMLATSSRRVQSMQILWREVQVAAVMGALMIVVGFGRVCIFEGDLWAAIAITASLWTIVSTSIILGAALPLALHRLRFDPAHAGPIIQVIMDVLGVLVTCAICSMILGSMETKELVNDDRDSIAIGTTAHAIAE